jgi:hypothetical protein
MFSKTFRLAIFLVLSLSFALVASAQTNATLQGVVSDANEAAIAGATVRVVNKANNNTREVVSRPDGGYSIPQLQPGIYEVTVIKPGFKSSKLDDFQLAVGQIR